jgi:hypothetical protein
MPGLTHLRVGLQLALQDAGGFVVLLLLNLEQKKNLSGRLTTRKTGHNS